MCNGKQLPRRLKFEIFYWAVQRPRVKRISVHFSTSQYLYAFVLITQVIFFFSLKFLSNKNCVRKKMETEIEWPTYVRDFFKVLTCDDCSSNELVSLYVLFISLTCVCFQAFLTIFFNFSLFHTNSVTCSKIILVEVGYFPSGMGIRFMWFMIGKV